MNFTSPVFFLFLPIVLLLYWGLPHKYRYLLLLAASYFFYAYYDVRLLALILVTTLVSYLCAISIEHADTLKRKRFFLGITLVTCLGILFVFKYLNFTVKSIYALCHFLGLDSSFSGFSILLPMGISFYVFQTMSYVIDVYRGDWHAQKHLGYYALFIVFFPQLVAGPIERPANLMPQLEAPHSLSLSDFLEGFRLLLLGYAKKVLIADYLAAFVDAAYEHVNTAGGAALLVATLLFSIQIYCDFSGYSDIALGCARFMGIRLSENFRRPYCAVSIRDFWRRWHISLTRWLTDYLYIPLGGSKKGTLLHCRNIMITFLVSGLWHGANWTYVIWGGLHGLFLITETLICRRKQETDTLHRHPLKQLLTFCLVCFAWIFFRSATTADALQVIRAILTDWNVANLLVGLQAEQLDLLLFLLMPLLLLWLEKLPAFSLSDVSPTAKQSQCHVALLYLLLILAIFLCRCMVLTTHGAASFIYFQF